MSDDQEYVPEYPLDAASGDVPTTGPAWEAGGPIQRGEGYGVKGGVPYGNTEQKRIRGLEGMYRFQPGWVARARAATARALGR